MHLASRFRLRAQVRFARPFILAMMVAIGTLGVGFSASPAAALPVLGNTRWAMLLCKYGDLATEPKPPSYFRMLLTESGAGTGNLLDYFKDVSYGQIDLTGSRVYGWYSLDPSLTRAVEKPKGRGQRIQDCI